MKRLDGEGTLRPDGYWTRQINGRRFLVHVLVAEKALGKKLPAGAVVHHVDEDPSNNDPTNLVICPDQAYHMLIHRRTEALAECGNANWMKCVICKQWADPSLGMRLYIPPRGTSPTATHRACISLYCRQQRAKRKEEFA